MNRQGNLFALVTSYHLRVEREREGNERADASAGNTDFKQEVAHGWGTQGPGRRGVRWAQR
jgi:hypothetical protein